MLDDVAGGLHGRDRHRHVERLAQRVRLREHPREERDHVPQHAVVGGQRQRAERQREPARVRPRQGGTTRQRSVETVEAASLQPLKNRKSPGRLAAAVFLGKARLIDNIALPVLP